MTARPTETTVAATLVIACPDVSFGLVLVVGGGRGGGQGSTMPLTLRSPCMLYALAVTLAGIE